MNEVQIEITAADGGYRSVKGSGTVAGTLRALLLRLGDSYPNDADMQRLVDAVAAVEVKQ